MLTGAWPEDPGDLQVRRRPHQDSHARVAPEKDLGESGVEHACSHRPAFPDRGRDLPTESPLTGTDSPQPAPFDSRKTATTVSLDSAISTGLGPR